MLSLCILEFIVSVRVFVIGESHISSFFSSYEVELIVCALNGKK